MYFAKHWQAAQPHGQRTSTSDIARCCQATGDGDAARKMCLMVEEKTFRTFAMLQLQQWQSHAADADLLYLWYFRKELSVPLALFRSEVLFPAAGAS